MHITSLSSCTWQLEQLLNLVFLLFLCSQTYPDAAKASTHWYMYTCYRSPAAFYDCLITVMIALLHTTATQQFFLYYPLVWVAKVWIGDQEYIQPISKLSSLTCKDLDGVDKPELIKEGENDYKKIQ